VGQVFIPTDSIGQVLIPYAGTSNLGNNSPYTYISAVDVLNGTLSPEQEEDLFNSLALVGATATGLFDLRSAPMEPVFPGVEVHANVLNALLSAAPAFTLQNSEGSLDAGSQFDNAISLLRGAQNEPFPSKLDWEEGAVIATIVVSGIFLSLVYLMLGPALPGVKKHVRGLLTCIHKKVKCPALALWVNSSAGRASPLQGECRGFKSLFTHQRAIV
jgi:hypothetical protein